MKFKDIKRFTEDGYYHVDVGLSEFKFHIDRYIERYDLQLNPDFQRGHVWTKEQKISYIEYVLRGGISSDIRLNHPGWMGDFEGEMVCVDGLQRTTAILEFLDDKFKVFGYNYSEFKGGTSITISLRINKLSSRKEVLKWYLELNSGGTIHTEEELERVRNLLEKE